MEYFCKKCGTKYEITHPGKYQCEICQDCFELSLPLVEKKLHCISKRIFFVIFLSILIIVLPMLILGMILFFQENKLKAIEESQLQKCLIDNNQVSSEGKTEHKLPVVEQDSAKYKIRHDNELNFEEKFIPDFKPDMISSLGFKKYLTKKTNFEFDHSYIVFTDNEGNILQTELHVYMDSYSIPSVVMANLAKNIMDQKGLSPISVSDDQVIFIDNGNSTLAQRKIVFNVYKTDLSVTYNVRPFPVLLNPGGKDITGGLGLKLGEKVPLDISKKNLWSSEDNFTFVPKEKISFFENERYSFETNIV